MKKDPETVYLSVSLGYDAVTNSTKRSMNLPNRCVSSHSTCSLHTSAPCHLCNGTQAKGASSLWDTANLVAEG